MTIKTPSKHRIGDKTLTALCVLMFVFGPYLAIFKVWGVTVVPHYQWIPNLLGLGCMFAWVFLSLYGLITGRFKYIPAIVIFALLLICGFIASFQVLVSLFVIEPVRCEATAPDILVCEENLGDMAVYQIQPDGIFMRSISIPTPAGQTK